MLGCWTLGDRTAVDLRVYRLLHVRMYACMHWYGPAMIAHACMHACMHWYGPAMIALIFAVAAEAE